MALFERSTGAAPSEPGARISGDQIVALFWTVHLGWRTRPQVGAELARLGFSAADQVDLVGWLDLFTAAPKKQQWSQAFSALFGLAQADFFGLRDRTTFNAALAKEALI